MESTALLLAALLLSFVLFGLWRAIERAWDTRRRRRMARQARRGELTAQRLLYELGYAIEAEQPAQPWLLEVEGQHLEIVLHADYLVSKRGERYVAEVKTGDVVASLRHGPTRRQLLEYQLAYRVAGVLLVDVLGASVVSVRFPGASG
jgi:hypothetical protein